MIGAKQVTFSGRQGSQRVTARMLIDVLERATRWLRTLDPDSPVDWEVVRVRMGSRVSLTFSNPNANGAVSSGMQGLNALQKRAEPKAPPRLSAAVLESTKELAEVVGTDLESLSISSPGTPTIKVTENLKHRVEKLVKPGIATRTETTTRKEWTTVEGVLDQITGDIDGTHSKFRIIHPLTGRHIGCTFDEGEIGLPEVMAAMKHRVAAYGVADIERSGGRVIAIEVTRMQRLPDVSAFDTIESIPKTTITDGMDSAEYIERVRGGDD